MFAVKPHVIVTGASSGIGRATARLLRERGCELLLVARRQEALAEVAGDAAYFCADVSDSQACREIVARARALWPTELPVLINSAGAVSFGEFHEMPIEDVDAQVRVNLLGTMYLCHAALPWMLEAGGGQIINVLSIAAKHVFPGGAAYGASKAGGLMFTRTLAAEYRGQGIRVTALIPGSTDTPLWDAQSFQPNRADMLPAKAVAEAIVEFVFMPKNRVVDELVLMPPKGIL